MIMSIRRSKGFTLIELVMVIVILGVLGAIAIPKFVDLQTEALVAAKAGMSGAVKSALAISIAQLKTYPTVTQLSGNVQGQGVGAVATGVTVSINGTSYTVPTYTDGTCGTPTVAVGNVVQCVGVIP
jgi:MSHA pilin protein MshA